MCDGCNDFFRSKRGVIRAAAAAQASRFVLVDDLICDIYYRTLRWKRQTDDYMSASNAFFYTVAKNLAIDCTRQRSRQEQFDDKRHEVLLTESVTLQNEEAERVKEMIEIIMDNIERPEDRDALFSFLTGEPIPVIADRLGITSNAASVRRRRAIERAASLVRNGRF